MEEKTQRGRESDYERNMESLGYEALRKSRKKAIIWTIVFAIIIVFGIITAQMIFIGLGLVLTIIGLVFVIKRSSKLKDDMEVRKAGLAEFKKGKGNVPSVGPSSSLPASSSYPQESSSSRPSSPSSTSQGQARGSSNMNNYDLKGSSRPSSRSTSGSRQIAQDENADPSIYGPIKGF